MIGVFYIVVVFISHSLNFIINYIFSVVQIRHWFLRNILRKLKREETIDSSGMLTAIALLMIQIY